MDTAPIKPDPATESILQDGLHSHCFACSPDNEHGLRLAFGLNPDGVTTAIWQPAPMFQSYNGRVHGGILATLMDSAMVHALFARGIAGVTAEMTVRYRAPVLLTPSVEISSWVTGYKHGIYHLQAEVHQDGRLNAHASAKFMATPGMEPSAPATGT